MNAARPVLITGGTSGIGRETARRLVTEYGAGVIITGRSAESLAPAARSVGAESLTLDLGSLEDVARAVEDLGARGLLPLAALVANAGSQFTGPSTSVDGFEATFAINHLGHVALIARLLAADGIVAPGGRIVVVSSGTHDPAERTGMPSPLPIDARALAAPAPAGESATESRRRYTTSKLANVMTAYELARRLEPRGICVTAYDPGLMPATGLSRDYGRVARVVYGTVGRALIALPGATTPRASSAHLAALAADPALAGVTGVYRARGKLRSSSQASYDEAAQRALWDDSLALAGLADPTAAPVPAAG